MFIFLVLPVYFSLEALTTIQRFEVNPFCVPLLRGDWEEKIVPLPLKSRQCWPFWSYVAQRREGIEPKIVAHNLNGEPVPRLDASYECALVHRLPSGTNPRRHDHFGVVNAEVKDLLRVSRGNLVRPGARARRKGTLPGLPRCAQQ